MVTAVVAIGAFARYFLDRWEDWSRAHDSCRPEVWDTSDIVRSGSGRKA